MPLSKQQTILMIVHERPQAPDNASDFLSILGYDIVWSCPALGQNLPVSQQDYVAAIVYPGPYAATEMRRYPFLANEIEWVERWLMTGRPFLGLGAGAQILAVALGAQLYAHPDGLSEIGFYTLDVESEGHAVFPSRMTVPSWHFLGFTLPDSAVRLASTAYFPNQAIRYAENAFGFQFRPEMTQHQHERLLEGNVDMTTIPGAQDIVTQRQMADIYLPKTQDWFIDFLSKWIAGKVLC